MRDFSYLLAVLSILSFLDPSSVFKSRGTDDGLGRYRAVVFGGVGQLFPQHFVLDLEVSDFLLVEVNVPIHIFIYFISQE